MFCSRLVVLMFYVCAYGLCSVVCMCGVWLVCVYVVARDCVLCFRVCVCVIVHVMACVCVVVVRVVCCHQVLIVACV